MTLFDQVPLLLKVWALQVEPARAQKSRLKASRDQKWHQKESPKGGWRPKVATIGSGGIIWEVMLMLFCVFFAAEFSIHFMVSHFGTRWAHLVSESVNIQGLGCHVDNVLGVG